MTKIKKPLWAVVLRDDLKSRGVSIGNLAEQCQVSKSTISRWFSGQAFVTDTEKIKSIITALKKSGIVSTTISGLVEATIMAGGVAMESMNLLIKDDFIAKPSSIEKFTIKEASEMHEAFTTETLNRFSIPRPPFGDLRGSGDVYMPAPLKKLEKHFVDVITLNTSMIVLTAPTGSGKTTFIKRVTSTLKSEHNFRILSPALMNMGKLTEQVIQRMVFDATGITKGVCPGDLQQRATKTHDALVELNDSNRVVLWIDQAEDLTDESITLLKRLNEMEDGWTQLLRIVISGQPSIIKRIQSHKNKQFTIRADFNELPSLKKAWPFIEFRLKKVGMSQSAIDKVFPADTRDAIEQKIKTLAKSGVVTPRAIENIVTRSLNYAAKIGDDILRPGTIEHVRDK